MKGQFVPCPVSRTLDEEVHMAGGGLVFLTVDGKDKNQNPWSVLMVKALRQHACTAVVIESQNHMVLADTIVPIFDLNIQRKSRCWSLCGRGTQWVPKWAFDLSTGSCLSVGRECVADLSRAKLVAQEIFLLFSRFCENKRRLQGRDGR